MGWGGVGWGINVHSLAHRYDVTPRHVLLHLRTYVMLLWRCFTSRRGWGGVGWGGVLTFTHLRTAMMWLRGTFTCTCAHTSCYFEDVSRHAGGGVGWGGVLTFTHLRTAMMWRHGTFTCTCAHTSCYFEDVSRHAGGGVGWGGVLTFTHLRTGGIDAYWTLLKDGIPNSITSTVGGKPNKLLWMYMRSQQWRWECHDKDILAQTGQTIREKGCPYPTRFGTRNPVRVNDRYFFSKKIRGCFSSKNGHGIVTT